MEKLKASSQVAALEAELVTGLKPIKLGSTRGTWARRQLARATAASMRKKSYIHMAHL